MRKDWFAAFEEKRTADMSKTGATRATRATPDETARKLWGSGMLGAVALAESERATRATPEPENRRDPISATGEAGAVAHVAQAPPEGATSGGALKSKEHREFPAPVAHVAHVAHANDRAARKSAADGWNAEDWRACYEERAAIAEHDANLPREWAEGFARLCTMPRPAAVRPERWTQVINDAGKFCDRWAAKAAALGWQTLDVFGCHHAKPDARLDAAGLVWLICGNEVVAIGPDAVILRTHSGASHTIRPRTVAAEGALRVAAWELEAGAT